MEAPELELTPDEAQRLGKAASEVARHYPLVATAKAQAWGQLMIVAGMVYVPRGIAIWHRRGEEATAGNTAPLASMAPMGAAAPNGPPDRPAATPSELDPLASLAGQAAAGAA